MRKTDIDNSDMRWILKEKRPRSRVPIWWKISRGLLIPLHCFPRYLSLSSPQAGSPQNCLLFLPGFVYRSSLIPVRLGPLASCSRLGPIVTLRQFWRPSSVSVHYYGRNLPQVINGSFLIRRREERYLETFSGVLTYSSVSWTSHIDTAWLL